MAIPRKNILFLANRVPFPPNKGDKIRTFHQLDHLATAHNVYCGCFVESPGDASHAEALRRWCADVVAIPWDKRRGLRRAAVGWLRGEPLTCAAYQDQEMYAALTRWTDKIDFDVVVAFSASMASYALSVTAARRVLDLCDVDSQKWSDYAGRTRFPSSWVYRSEGRRLRAFEEACLESFDATILITERERDILDPRRSCRTLHVIPNGAVLPAEPPEPASRRGPVIGFLGAMDYRPNVDGVNWFVERVWPSVRQCVPQAKLLIVGRNPVEGVRRLARVAGVEVTGEVQDVQPYLAQCRVVIAPMRVARGIQNKVLEAMAMRRPVVATAAVGACLQVTPGHSIQTADEAEEFAKKVADLCDFDGLCDQIGEAGYRCVATYYSWTETLQRYEHIVLGRRPAPFVRKAGTGSRPGDLIVR